MMLARALLAVAAAQTAVLAARLADQLRPPQVCYENVGAHGDPAQTPANDTRRVALLLRGESFRGVHMGMKSDVKRDVVCVPSSYAIQKATAENIVSHVIEALESQGVAVDVFVSTYGCVGTPFSGLSDGEARRWHGDLVSWLGAERVVDSALVARGAFGLVPGNGDKETQQAAMVASFDKLEAHVRALGHGENVGAVYRSVLMWRFDVITTVKWASPASEGHLAVDRSRFFEVDMDHVYSSPAWFYPCFSAMLRTREPTSCLERDVAGYNTHRCNRLWREVLTSAGASYSGHKDLHCAEETKATLVADPSRQRKSRATADADGADDAKKRRRDPFDFERKPDDHGACPRPHVYRTTEGRGAPYCDFLHRHHGGPPCAKDAHIGELRTALASHIVSGDRHLKEELKHHLEL